MIAGIAGGNGIIHLVGKVSSHVKRRFTQCNGFHGLQNGNLQRGTLGLFYLLVRGDGNGCVAGFLASKQAVDVYFGKISVADFIGKAAFRGFPGLRTQRFQDQWFARPVQKGTLIPA